MSVDWLALAKKVAALPAVKKLATSIISKPAKHSLRYTFLLSACEVTWQAVEFSRTRTKRLEDHNNAAAEFAVRLGALSASAGYPAPNQKEWIWIKRWLDERCKLDKRIR